MNVRQFLQERDIPHRVLDHDRSYTAQTLAAAVHVCGDEVAKTVLLWTDDDYLLAVLPATHTIDLNRVEMMLGMEIVELATEKECGEGFRDCELGALPPFGSQYHMKTIIDESLMEDEEIVFEGNTHSQAIRMKREDYMALENPMVGSFSHHF